VRIFCVLLLDPVIMLDMYKYGQVLDYDDVYVYMYDYSMSEWMYVCVCVCYVRAPWRMRMN
jgi:hypothetical protein